MLLFYFLALIRNRQEQQQTDEIITDKKGISVGIDLGTTYSCLFIHDPNTKNTFNIKVNNHETLPSILAFDVFEKAGKKEFLPVVGYEAKSFNDKNPNSNNLFYAWKRLMGLSDKDMNSPGLKDIHKKVTYKISVENKDKGSVISMLHKDLNNNLLQKVRPIDASKFILQALYEAARKYSENIATVVVTVPAYFTENQVKATSNAVEFSGIKLTRTMNEPVAAAYAYQIKEGSKKDDKYFVFDFGGGTLDISALEYEDDVLEVRTYSGDNFLGGENVNDCLFNYFLKEVPELKTESERLRLRNFVEKFKIKLCEEQLKSKANVSITEEFALTEDEIIELSLDTKKFNEICMPVFKKVEKYLLDEEEGVVEKYKKLGGSKSQVSKVLLVGGSSRIPFVRKILENIFGKEKLYTDLNADTVVAEGAAWYSANLAGYLDEKDSLMLVDVVSANIGICVSEDEFHAILEMDTTIPAKGTKVFTTAYDMQDRVSIQVAQGQRAAFSQNQKLGVFDLVIAKPGPRGVPQIEVTVSIDKDRNVHVKAVDKETNKEEEVKFHRDDCSLTADEILRMKKDKELNKEKDEELLKRFESKRNLENYVYSAKGLIKEKKIVDERVIGIVDEVESFLKIKGSSAEREEFENKLKDLKVEVDPFLNEAMKNYGQKNEEFKKEDFKGEEEKIREEL
ncbi:hypothetical protein GVAV_002723 [Gurleya vavrai]